MVSFKLLITVAAVLGVSVADPSALDVLQDMYRGCISQFSVSCVRPKALAWISMVADRNVIKVTDDLMIVKKDDPEKEVVRVMCVVRDLLFLWFCDLGAKRRRR